MKVIEWHNLNKSFGPVQVLRDLNGGIEEGQITILNGVSGSGKSTLLNILGLLEPFDSGTISWWGERQIKPFSRKAEEILATRIGYLFQNFALVDDQTVRRNLLLALETVRAGNQEKQQMLKRVMHDVGLPESLLYKYVYQCSGGEQQRVAIARLLLKKCDLILCDEPTGSLDEANRDSIVRLLLDLNRQGKTIVIATHDPKIKSIGQQVIPIRMLRGLETAKV